MHQSAQDMITGAERIARALAERDTPPGRPINQTEVYRHRIAALERIVRDLACKLEKAEIAADLRDSKGGDGDFSAAVVSERWNRTL